MKMKKNKLFFSIYNFTVENFLLELQKNLSYNSTYSLLIKISSQNNMIFRMCGPQIVIVITDTHNIEYYKNLYKYFKIYY